MFIFNVFVYGISLGVIPICDLPRIKQSREKNRLNHIFIVFFIVKFKLSVFRTNKLFSIQ